MYSGFNATCARAHTQMIDYTKNKQRNKKTTTTTKTCHEIIKHPNFMASALATIHGYHTKSIGTESKNRQVGWRTAERRVHRGTKFTEGENVTHLTLLSKEQSLKNPKAPKSGD